MASRISRDRQEQEMFARWRKEYGDADDDDDAPLLYFPPDKLYFNVFYNEDDTLCFVATPAEHFDLTGNLYDQHFEIEGLDEVVWGELMEGVWETDVFTTLEEAVSDLEDLGMRRNQRLDTSEFVDDDDSDDDDSDDDFEDLDDDDSDSEEEG